MKDIIWKGERISRFVLGTAQLGMDYGIANVQGQPTEEQAREIVKTALGYGINCFDTAQAYGNSEITLGKALKYCGAASDIKIVSKLSPELQPTDNKSVEQSIETSRQNLGIDQLWCLMLHRADWIDVWGEGLGQTLGAGKESGDIKYLGVSVYSLDGARRALEHPNIQVIEVPCNLWDQRMLREGIFNLAKKRDKLCFVRSIYLQGLLLLSPENVAKKLPVARGASQKWCKLAAKFGMEREHLSISFGLSLNMPLVIGAESIQQVNENVRLCEQSPLSADATQQIWDKMSPVLSDDIVSPMLWGK
jgi:aryl-alcohol dehydrogenase-like predicted oxidoreductase